VKDEQYHRHIIQHNLFQPVFDTFRENPVGDNLVSSTIVEICDFIHNEKIKSVLEHIVTKHLMFSDPKGTIPSLEDVSGPYVSTLSLLRSAYESSLMTENDNNQIENYIRNETNNGNREGVGSQYFTSIQNQGSDGDGMERNAGTGTVVVANPTRHLTGKALEDQRKFREIDDEESYFDSDEDGPGGSWNQ
jgi:protein phosphatase-4 regulatory subunit 3